MSQDEGFSKTQWMGNGAYAPEDFTQGMHMFLEIVRVVPYSICVQANTSSKTEHPLVKLKNSVFKKAVNKQGSLVSVCALYVMQTDMAWEYGREATMDEISNIIHGIKRTIGKVHFTFIDYQDSGFVYTPVSPNEHESLMSRLVKELKINVASNNR